MTRTRWQRLSSLITLALALVAIGIVVHVLNQFTWAQIEASLARIRPWQFAGAVLCTAASYATLTGFDWLGVAYAGGRVPYRRVALACFLSLSIGHTVGFAPLSSGAIRYRYYTEAGLDLRQIGLVVLLSAVTVTLGEVSLGGLAMVIQPVLTAKLLHLPPAMTGSIGAACLVLPVAYGILAVTLRRPFTIHKWSFRLPTPGIAVAQIGLGLLNYILVAGALYFVLSAVAPIDFQSVAAAFVLGNLAALITHVPGGLGVLEAVIATLLPGIDLIGPLIAFRIIYYLIPLAIGCLVLAATELKLRVRPTKAKLTP
ncbi:MAG TPA: lysylphosphatidylglycerol synthase domain-containing protein [Aliidongia sp.]|nr:lysylphosphatidylglycerol synthase domain-containing protein [Aliidongia sp.]